MSFPAALELNIGHSGESGTARPLDLISSCFYSPGAPMRPFSDAKKRREKPGRPVPVFVAEVRLPPDTRAKVPGARTAQRTIRVPEVIAAAIRRSAHRAHQDPRITVAIAYSESALRPDAHNPKSSAGGLGGVTIGTWLTTIKRDGAGIGLANLAREIILDGPHPQAASPKARHLILALREDLDTQADILAQIIRDNINVLVSNRFVPSGPNIGLVHFFGENGGIRFIKDADRNPDAIAAPNFPKTVVEINKPIFFDYAIPKHPRPRTYAEIQALFRAVLVPLPQIEVIPTHPANKHVKSEAKGSTS